MGASSVCASHVPPFNELANGSAGKPPRLPRRAQMGLQVQHVIESRDEPGDNRIPLAVAGPFLAGYLGYPIENLGAGRAVLQVHLVPVASRGGPENKCFCVETPR